MPAFNEHLVLRVSNLTAFLRFDAGLVRGEEPLGERERLLSQRVQELEAYLSATQESLTNTQAELTKAQWQLNSPTSNLPQKWFWTAYIVSDKHRFVYMTNYKVATTSILLSLLPLFDFDVKGADFDNVTRGPRFARNDKKIEDIHHLFSEHNQINKAHFLAGLDNRYQHYFKFTFVRNPWDRLVSCYNSKFVKGGTGLRMGKYGEVSLRSGMPFGDFAEAVCQVPDEAADPHFRSQHVTICQDSPEKAILADFVGRFENLQEDFGNIAQEVGLKARLSHINKSKNNSSSAYRDFYDKRIARMVGERYREDADIFGYSF
jgi:hypothetical protein